MPYKDKLVGIYKIETPNGSKYIGSSTNIYLRWAEHRSHLKRQTHHSARLQMAYIKHGDDLLYEILELCSINNLNDREQYYIDTLGGELNTTVFVNNVWANEETRKKLELVHQSDEWREVRSVIAKRIGAKRAVAVECSDGRVFDSMSQAGRELGVSAGCVRALVKWQHLGVLGVRLKKANDDWMPLYSKAEKIRMTRKNNGTRHSKETRQKMSIAKKGKMPPQAAVDGAIAKHSIPVKSKRIGTQVVTFYPSIAVASSIVKKSNIATARSQISKACAGVKKTAYGYYWAKLDEDFRHATA